MSLHRDYARFALLALMAALGGCSAVINPDTDRLPGVDGGALVDAGTQDADDTRDGDVPPRDGDVPPLDSGPCVGGCDDGVPCTVDACGATGCTHEPSDGACSSSERCSVLMGCVPRLCTSDSSCSNGLFCDGAEHCDAAAAGADPATGCVDGTPPSCFDDYDCTADSCDEAADACAFSPDDTRCDDGIDCSADACNPGAAATASGCVATPNDALCPGACATVGGNPGVRPGLCRPATGGCVVGTAVSCLDGDLCTADRCVAGACSSTPLDADGDGYAAGSVGATMCGGDDCDDGDGDINPGATEACNRVDDNCNGVVDEGCPVSPPDDCATAAALTGSGGVLSASGTFSSFSDDYLSTCVLADGGRNGRDAVYYFDLTTLSDVVVTTNGATVDTVLAVATECSGAGFGLGCDDDIASANTASRIFLHRFGPGPGGRALRVYVLVDAYGSGVTGAFTVTATITPAAADSCSAPIDISGGGTLVGEIAIGVGATGPSGSCQPFGDRFDPEGIATFLGSADGTETFVGASRSFIPALYVRDAPCASGTEDSCIVGTSAGGTGGRATLNATVPDAARGYLFVDNGTVGGRYTVDFIP